MKQRNSLSGTGLYMWLLWSQEAETRGLCGFLMTCDPQRGSWRHPVKGSLTQSGWEQWHVTPNGVLTPSRKGHLKLNIDVIPFFRRNYYILKPRHHFKKIMNDNQDHRTRLIRFSTNPRRGLKVIRTKHRYPPYSRLQRSHINKPFLVVNFFG